MTKLPSWLATTGAIIASGASAGTVRADSQADIAARENDAGRELMYAAKYDEATAKFQDAAARAPEAKYFFNLCASLYQEGKYGDALTACDSAAQNKPDAKLEAKIDRIAGRIKDEALKQGLDLRPVGGDSTPPPSTNVPPPSTNVPPSTDVPPPSTVAPYPPVVGRPPPDRAVFAGVRPDHDYTWTLGIDGYAGTGTIGRTHAYGSAMAGVRLAGDVLINWPHRVGAQLYVQLTRVTAGSDQAAFDVGAMQIVDAGLALYKHVCLRANDHVCVTPLIGFGVALFSPNAQMDDASSALFDYWGLHVRGELEASYAFGPRLEHVISAQLGFSGYSKVLGEPTDGSPTSAMIGLDTAGGFGYLGVGYTYRFDTPLGASPLVTLE